MRPNAGEGANEEEEELLEEEAAAAGGVEEDDGVTTVAGLAEAAALAVTAAAVESSAVASLAAASSLPRCFSFWKKDICHSDAQSQPLSLHTHSSKAATSHQPISRPSLRCHCHR